MKASDKILSSRRRGDRSMMPSSGGSMPRPIAGIKSVPTSTANTPITVIASGMPGNKTQKRYGYISCGLLLST